MRTHLMRRHGINPDESTEAFIRQIRYGVGMSPHLMEALGYHMLGRHDFNEPDIQPDDEFLDFDDRRHRRKSA